MRDHGARRVGVAPGDPALAKPGGGSQVRRAARARGQTRGGPVRAGPRPRGPLVLRRDRPFRAQVLLSESQMDKFKERLQVGSPARACRGLLRRRACPGCPRRGAADPAGAVFCD